MLRNEYEHGDNMLRDDGIEQKDDGAKSFIPPVFDDIIPKPQFLIVLPEIVLSSPAPVSMP